MSIESKLSEYIKKLNGPATINQLFTSSVIKKYTSYNTAEELFLSLGVIDQASYDAWAECPSDDQIRANTNVDSWETLFTVAAKELAKTRQDLIRRNKSTSPIPADDSPFANIIIDVTFSAV